MNDLITYEYTPVGICSKKIIIEVTPEQTIDNVVFEGGCPGNHEAINKLIAGMTIDNVIDILAGTPCGKRPTSCADQLVQALKKLKTEYFA